MVILNIWYAKGLHWEDHFRWRGPQLIGLTPIGRVTIRVLAINDPDAISLRRMLIAEGSFPRVEGSANP
jgi:hypothetical protein